MSTMSTETAASRGTDDDVLAQILAFDVSDQALEAAAARPVAAQALSFSFCTSPDICPWWR